jgi:hypothetical protein
VDLWTGPLRGLPDFRALRRSPVDGRMDNPAGCPRVHPQAVGCPQAPQGSTTNDRNPQVKTPHCDQPSWAPPTRLKEPLDRPFQQPFYNPPRATQPPAPPAVTFPKSSVTFAEMRREFHRLDFPELVHTLRAPPSSCLNFSALCLCQWRGGILSKRSPRRTSLRIRKRVRGWWIVWIAEEATRKRISDTRCR